MPVQNSSGPLWTALVAAGFVVFGSNALVVKVLGALRFLGCIAITANLFPEGAGIDDVDDSLWEMEARYGIEANDFDSMLKIPRWREVMSEQVSVLRAWGTAGLFWALLQNRLEAEGTASHCERCQRIVFGTRRRRFCSRTDNEECFNQRRASDQRRSCEGRSAGGL